MPAMCNAAAHEHTLAQVFLLSGPNHSQRAVPSACDPSVLAVLGSASPPRLSKTFNFPGPTLTCQGRDLDFEGRTLTFEGRSLTFEGRTLTSQGRTLTFQGQTLTFQGRTLTFQGQTLTFWGRHSTSRMQPSVSRIKHFPGMLAVVRKHACPWNQSVLHASCWF